MFPIPHPVLISLCVIGSIIGSMALICFIRFIIDERENNIAGVNKRNRYMLRYEYEAANICVQRYYTGVQMQSLLQPHRKMGMVLCGYPNAKQVFEHIKQSGMAGARDLKWEYDKCSLTMMEERSYFGIKAWYKLETAYLK